MDHVVHSREFIYLNPLYGTAILGTQTILHTSQLYISCPGPKVYLKVTIVW